MSFLLQTAEVLEKTAAYLERIDSEKVAKVQEETQKKVSELAEKISAITGESLDDETVSKIAGLSPDVQEIIGRIAGGGAVDSLGGPDDMDKVASVSGGMGSAENSFLSFLMS
jgi:hypothetical protein